MEISVHGAWEIVSGIVSVSAGEIIKTEPFVDNKLLVGESPTYVTLHTKGTVTFENIKTGEKINVKEGDFYPFDIPLSPGEYKVLIDSDMEHLCISPFTHNNMQYHPLEEKISPFKLKSGQSVVIEQNKRLFLVKGLLQIDSKNYSGVNRIKFSSGNKNVKALDDSYGFFINT